MAATRVIPSLAALFGTVALFLMMAREGHLPFGQGLGIVVAVIAAWGWATLLVGRSQGETTPWRGTVFGGLADEPPWARLGVGLGASFVMLLLGVGVGGAELAPVTILLSLALLLPASMRRPGLLVFVVVSAMYLPLLGSYALWDPWESHYAEVAREILARDDWISLWWAQDHWFWSKPVLLFWAEALTMGALGVDFMPDANPTAPEWAIRLPVYAMSIAAVLVIYATVRRMVSTRAGVLAALVVATMPHFFLLSHQAITDMPLVASTTIALCLLLLAIDVGSDAKVKTYRVGPFEVSLQHVVIGAIVLVALPQALYLITRNVAWDGGLYFEVRPDKFLFGSAGNDGIPGNPNHSDKTPAIDGLLGQPFFQGLGWLVGIALVGWSLHREQRTQRLYMTAFYFFCAIALLAKGLPGLALPGVVALLFLIASRRWALLGHGHFAIAPGALVVIVVALPWYLAMFVRHGVAFTNRLIIHDHINRLAAGVHGDKGSIQYFIEQLGYAAFPWIALVPVALLLWAWAQQPRERQVQLFVWLWFFASFALFSAMVTKFHHYIFPAIVPLGILVGIVLDRLLGSTSRREGLGFVLAVVCIVGATIGVGGLRGDVRGIVPADAIGVTDWVLQNGLDRAMAWGLIALAVVAGLGAWRWAPSPTERLGQRARWEEASIGAALAVGAVLLAFVGRDLSWVTTARPQGYERLTQLFIYNYKRPWPEQFDYRPILIGFAMVAVVVFALGMMRAFRPLMARLALALAICFCAWSVNVYVVDLADHWSTRLLVKRYYELRNGPEEPFVAWQMNWKGENFYTGNRAHIFVDQRTKKLMAWLDKNPGKRAFFVFEHTRLKRFQRLVGSRQVRELSTKRESNKYLLVELEI